MDTKNQPNIAEEELKKFAASLVAEKKFEVEPEVLEQITSDVYDRAENIINAAILTNTPPEKLEELNQLLDSGEKDALEQFCNANIPDLQTKVAEALAGFRDTYLSLK